MHKLLVYVMASFLVVTSLQSIDAYDQELERTESYVWTREEPIFISLGSSCIVGHHLRYFGLREVAFPLDWVLSIDNAGLIALLKDDFLYYTDENHLKPHSNGFLLNTCYHLQFPYEGDWRVDPYEETMEKFKSKYQRRIERFRGIASFPGKVVFIRAAYIHANNPDCFYTDTGNLVISKEWSFELYNALKNRFPSLDFHLVIMNISSNQEVKISNLSEGITVVESNPVMEAPGLFEANKQMFIQVLQDQGLHGSKALQKLND